MRSIIIILFALIIQPALAQEGEIRSTFNEYFGKVNEGDIAGSMDYIYPKLFDIIPREQMQTAMEQAFNNPEAKLSMEDGTITEISDVVEEAGVRYARVDYSFDLHMTMANPIDPATREQMMNAMKTQMPDGEVTYDEAANKFILRNKSSVYAINEGNGEWKFLEKNPQMANVIGQLIPTTVTDQI